MLVTALYMRTGTLTSRTRSSRTRSSGEPSPGGTPAPVPAIARVWRSPAPGSNADNMKASYLVRGTPGHPLHPPLTDAVIGSYTFATIAALFDVAGWSEKSAAHGWWLALLVGLVITVPTALTGLLDWLTITRWRRALEDGDGPHGRDAHRLAPLRARGAPRLTDHWQGGGPPGAAVPADGRSAMWSCPRRMARRRDRVHARDARVGTSSTSRRRRSASPVVYAQEEGCGKLAPGRAPEGDAPSPVGLKSCCAGIDFSDLESPRR